VTTTKRRWVRKFAAGSEIVEVDPDDRPECACNVDLVVVEVSGDRWWTLGLEAFGPRAAVRVHLADTAAHWFDRPPPMPLRVTQSAAYPTWAAAFAAAPDG
jgi:hypothetical protein